MGGEITRRQRYPSGSRDALRQGTRRRGWLIRLASLALGGWAVLLLIQAAGTNDVMRYIQAASTAIVWLIALELVRLATEVAATSVQLGRFVRPLGVWRLIRGHLLSYATNTLAPAGRVAGEAIKAASYAPMLGTSVAAALAVRIQAVSLFAGAAMSGICAVVCLTAGCPAWLSIGLVILTALAVGAGALLMRPGRWGGASKTAGRLRLSLEALRRGTDALPRAIGAATLCLFVGRCIQVAQMGLLLAVLSRLPALTEALTMQGIFMVGTAAGDLIPGQLGVTDAAFSFGASSFAVTAGQGLAVAAIIHVAQITMAAVCSLGALLGPAHSAQNPTGITKPAGV